MRTTYPQTRSPVRRALKLSVAFAHSLLLAAVVILEGGTLLAWARAAVDAVGGAIQALSGQPLLLFLIGSGSALALVRLAGRVGHR